MLTPDPITSFVIVASSRLISFRISEVSVDPAGISNTVYSASVLPVFSILFSFSVYTGFPDDVSLDSSDPSTSHEHIAITDNVKTNSSAIAHLNLIKYTPTMIKNVTREIYIALVLIRCVR